MSDQSSRYNANPALEISREAEIVLFNAGVRALGRFGFVEMETQFGGKKSRRRGVIGQSPLGDSCSIWVKSTVPWHGMADVVRFPWSKSSAQGDSLLAVLFAIDNAIGRGDTHLLAVSGSGATGELEFARLYTLDDAKKVAEEQRNVCHHSFYVNHGAALIIRAYQRAFADAEAIVLKNGEDILMPKVEPRRDTTSFRARYRPTYRRNAGVREAVLQLANGHCERCGQQGFLTTDGEYFLETHHIVGVAERGPDTLNNVIAVCPNCHRQAHFAADRIKVEIDLMEAIRRRRRERQGST